MANASPSRACARNCLAEAQATTVHDQRRLVLDAAPCPRDFGPPRIQQRLTVAHKDPFQTAGFREANAWMAAKDFREGIARPVPRHAPAGHTWVLMPLATTDCLAVVSPAPGPPDPRGAGKRRPRSPDSEQ